MAKENHNISILINACKSGNKEGQRKLHQLFFNYGMSVALRYSNNRTDADEILNDSFFKVFSKIDQYDERYDFKVWFRRIIVNTSIDHFRKFKNLQFAEIEEAQDNLTDQNLGWDNLLYEDIIKHVQALPPSYRIVFNLFVIDGYKHREIAERLNITVGSSKSNYSKARKQLQLSLKKSSGLNIFQYGQ